MDALFGAFKKGRELMDNKLCCCHIECPYYDCNLHECWRGIDDDVFYIDTGCLKYLDQ